MTTHKYEQRLRTGGAFTSSPIAADGKIYVSDEEGQTFVIRAGRRFQLVGMNQLGELVLATPAISDRALYVRTTVSVLAIAE